MCNLVDNLHLTDAFHVVQVSYPSHAITVDSVTETCFLARVYPDAYASVHMRAQVMNWTTISSSLVRICTVLLITLTKIRYYNIQYMYSTVYSTVLYNSARPAGHERPFPFTFENTCHSFMSSLLHYILINYKRYPRNELALLAHSLLLL